MIFIFFSITRRVVFLNAKHPNVYFRTLFFSFRTGKLGCYVETAAGGGLVKLYFFSFFWLFGNRSSTAHAANRYAQGKQVVLVCNCVRIVRNGRFVSPSLCTFNMDARSVYRDRVLILLFKHDSSV